MRPLNILIWHIHGAYLTAITQTIHNWYVPTKPHGPEGYVGRGKDSTMPPYVREIPAEEVRNLDLNVVICQTPRNYELDRFEILSTDQQRLPTIYLEHNRLMWDNGHIPTRVIEHSVAIDPTLRYDGQRREGIVVVNELQRRGRMAGFDLFEQMRQRVPLTVAGMKSAEIGGIGEIHYSQLHHRVAEYRFLFSPMRYSSLPLAVIEAMTIGMPIVALATTELPTVIQNGIHGFVSADPDELIERMQFLLDNPVEAKRMGDNARHLALSRFSLSRFVQDWNAVLLEVTSAVG